MILLYLKTFLERIKATFLGVPGLSPDRIAPTVGLNSKFFFFSLKKKIQIYIMDSNLDNINLSFNQLVGKIDVNRARLNFWDLGGQRELHGIWEKYYSECHAIVFVVDSTDKERIEECKEVFGK